MSIAKQTIAIALAAGVDGKTDPKQVIAGKLLTLENAVFTSKNRLKKRNGFADFGQDIIDQGGSIDNGQGLAPYLDELLLWDGNELYSRDQVNDQWVDKGTFQSVNCTLQPIVRNSYQQTAQDGALHSSGLRCYAWEDSQGGVRYSVIDQTGLNIVHDALVDANGVRPKVIVAGNYLQIIYFRTTDTRLYSFAIPVAQPGLTITPVAITPASGTSDAAISGTAATVAFDASTVNTVAGELTYVAYSCQLGSPSITVGGITIIRIPPNNPNFIDLSLTVSGSGGVNLRAIAVSEETTQLVPTVAYVSGGLVKYFTYDYSLNTRLSQGTLDSGSFGSASFNIGITPVDHSLVRAFYTVTGSNASAKELYSVRTNTYSTAGGAGTPTTLLRSVGVSGKPFMYSGKAYVPVAHQSPTGTNLQTSYFVADDSGSLVAKLEYGLGGGMSTRTGLPETSRSGTSTFILPLLAKDSLQVSGGLVFTQTGVEEARLDFNNSQDSFLRAELGENLHVGGGFVMMYDGVSPVEHGFHLFPEGLSLTSAGVGGQSAGSYFYCQTYEWPDGRGQQHRSAPSPAVQINVLASTAVTATMPTLALTDKLDTRSPVQLVLYRTIVNAPAAANGGLPNFYRVSSVTAPTANDPTVDTLTLIDTLSDATLLGNQPLYTNGGVIENIAAPPVGPIVVHKNRLFAIDTTSPSTVWFTKEVVPGTRIIEGAPAEWSDQFTLSVDPRGGDATALGSLDDNLVVFKRNSVFLISGDGPTAAGNGGFNSPQLVTTDCGCQNQRSVVITPNGLMFQSSKGIYMLSRQGQASYIGAEVERYNDQFITSAVLVPTTNQVRFTLESGICLVYDYYFQQWGVFTNVDAVDSCIFQNLHTFLTPEGQVRQETPGVFSDAGKVIRMKLTTSWLSFAGLQGFQRVYKAIILGEYVSPHRLRASLAFDFNPAQVQTDWYDTAALLGQPNVYGTPSPYGQGAELSGFGDLPFGFGPFGGSAVAAAPVCGGQFPLYQFKLFMSQQKCQSVQITLEDVPSVVGEAMSLSAISLEVGVKRGLVKTPSAKSS